MIFWGIQTSYTCTPPPSGSSCFGLNDIPTLKLSFEGWCLILDFARPHRCLTLHFIGVSFSSYHMHVLWYITAGGKTSFATWSQLFYQIRLFHCDYLLSNFRNIRTDDGDVHGILSIRQTISDNKPKHSAYVKPAHNVLNSFFLFLFFILSI